MTGRRILSSVAALTAAGVFLADWNRTHLFNPDWPPHARYHDAQTMLLGSLLGGSGLYFLRRSGRDPERDLALGTLLPSLFWISQAGSFLFPGAEDQGVWLNERVPSALMLGLLAVGYSIERRA